MDKQKLAETFVQLIDVPKEGKKVLVEELKAILVNVANTDLNEAMASALLETLFECLDTTDVEQIQTTCDILKALLAVIDPKEFLSKYEVYVLDGFKHPVYTIRAIVLSQIQRFLDQSPDAAHLLCSEYEDLIIAAINQICCNDLSVVKLSEQFLVNLAKKEPGTQFLLGPAGIESFNSILNSSRNSDVIKFRAYEVLINLGRISPNHLSAIEDQNHLLIQPLIQVVLNSDDPSGQLKSLEILADLVDTPHGYEAVLKTGIVQKLQTLSQNWKEDANAGLIFPGIIKFIGKIGTRVFPDEQLVMLVLDAINERNLDVATVAVEALIFIGSTADGKKELDKLPDLKKCFLKIQSILQGIQPFRSRVINALSVLFDSDILGVLIANTIKERRNSQLLRLLKCEALLMLGQFEKALHWFNSGIVGAECSYLKSVFEFYEGNIEEARHHSYQAYCLAPENQKVVTLFTGLSRFSFKFESELEFRKIISEEAHEENVAIRSAAEKRCWNKLLSCLDDLGKIQEMLPSPNKKLQARVMRRLAALAFKSTTEVGNLKTAGLFIDQALDTQVELLPSFALRGRIYKARGLFELAIVDFQKYLMVEDNVEIRKELAQCIKALCQFHPVKKFYRTLNLRVNFTHEELRTAYKSYALQHHPDKHMEDSKEDRLHHEKIFKKLQEAYETLRDPVKRKKYDEDVSLDLSPIPPRQVVDIDAVVREFLSVPKYKPM